MPANTAPIFPLTPALSWVKLTTANTATDGTGTVGTLAAAGANGKRVDTIRCRALGTNVATVARLFVNNGSANSTATNNSLIAEVTLPATAASNAERMGPEINAPINLALPAGYKLLVVIGTSVAAGWQFTEVTGDY